MPSSASATTATHPLSLHDALPISPWDAVVLTCASESQATAARDELARRDALGLFPAGCRVLALADPPGQRAGSGGATLLALETLAQDRKSTRLNSSHANLVCRLLLRPPPRPTLFPYTTLFRSRPGTPWCSPAPARARPPPRATSWRAVTRSACSRPAAACWPWPIHQGSAPAVVAPRCSRWRRSLKIGRAHV